MDPTQTGLNLILHKGENRLGSISNILIGNRADPFSWSSDITKLYNQLHLHESAYPYFLILYSDELNLEKKPEVWLMTVGLYGFPLAVKCLTDC